MSIDAVILDFSTMSSSQITYLQKDPAYNGMPSYKGFYRWGAPEHEGFVAIGNVSFIKANSFDTRLTMSSCEETEYDVVNAYLLHGIFEHVIRPDHQLNTRYSPTWKTSAFLQNQLEDVMKKTGITLSEDSRNNFKTAIDDIHRSDLFTTLYPDPRKKYDPIAAYKKGY